MLNNGIIIFLFSLAIYQTGKILERTDQLIKDSPIVQKIMVEQGSTQANDMISRICWTDRIVLERAAIIFISIVVIAVLAIVPFKPSMLKGR